MLYNDFTEKMLGLQDVIITKIENSDSLLNVFLKTKLSKQKCIACSAETNTIHDYRTQAIKDIPAFGKQVTITLKKRRYRCPKCGKRFYEQIGFLPKYYRTTTRLTAYIIDKLREVNSYTSISKEVGLSVSTVIRRFDTVNYPRPKLTRCVAIDEFKGNTGNEKYNCILTDPENKRVLDILPKRYNYHLSSYMNYWTTEQRSKVDLFVSDMWKPYSDMASVWFKNATQIVDKYHWIRQINWAFENVRKQEQKAFGKQYRRYFKKSRILLNKRFESLTDEQKQQVNILLYASVNLSRAHYYKESFQEILDCNDRESAKSKMKKWIESASDCGINQMEQCAKTMQNWIAGILNSFSHTVTNGFTEGCNNKIKVLKRNAYGFRNFTRFRNRILHIFSDKNLIQKHTAA